MSGIVSCRVRVSRLLALGGALLAAQAASAAAPQLVVSKMNYSGTANTLHVGDVLPTKTSKGKDIKATADGGYLHVFDNLNADPNFGVTAAISLDYLAVAGGSAALDHTVVLPNGQISGSFSSKSEGALNLSTDGKVLTIAGYAAAANKIDVSNSNTPNHVDPTNPDQQTYARAVAQINAAGAVTVTSINAYSGDNPRAVILAGGAEYLVGNSNNGTGTPDNIVSTTGVQLADPVNGGETTKIGAFNSGFADKPGKADNYRGLTVFDNTLFVTKGSGSNGVNSVYQVGAAGTLPTDPNSVISILPGFPTVSAKTSTDNFYPFGIWFANADTLYVADDGNGAVTALSGLQKWSRNNGVWSLDYVMQAGLGLGASYTVNGSLDGVSGAASQYTVGLRNITGQVNGDGTVSIYAITATGGGFADPGANPNRLVGITDTLANIVAPVGESFTTLKQAAYGETLRGVAFAPDAAAVPEPASWALAIVGFGLTGGALRRRGVRAAG